MKKTIFEEMGGIYIRHGDYLIPGLTLPEEEQAQERFERIVEQMKQEQGITEHLKIENQMEWVVLFGKLDDAFNITLNATALC